MSKYLDKKETAFNAQLFSEIADAQKNATVYEDTQTVIIEPNWPEDVTQESLKKHVDFIHRQKVITAAAASNIAYERYPDLKVENWRGCTDLGAVTINARTNLIERYEIDKERTEYDYGIVDIAVDMKLEPELTDFMHHFAKLDYERCKDLFDAPVGVEEEDKVASA